MPLRISRWTLAGIGAVVALVPATLLLSHGGAPRVDADASARRPGAALDAVHQPWYGLRLLLDQDGFSDSAPEKAPPFVPNAAAGILVDIDTHQILWQSNAHRQLPPASLIKLLTAMVVLENYKPDALITVRPDALFQAGDESKMYLKAGQTLTVAELLTGLLTVSANDAADVFAQDTVGMEKFVGAMNAQAAALGLHDTHATSPVGLDDPATYSSASDLATMAAIDYKHWALFRQVVDTQYTVLPATATHPIFYLNNLNLLLSMYPAAVGIKTGYTGDAGNCLVAMAVRNGHSLISVLLNAPYVYGQSRKLLDWGFVQEGLPTQLPTPSPSPSPTPHH